MKPKFNKDETEMTLGGKTYTFKLTNPSTCLGCAFCSGSRVCQSGIEFEQRKCGFTYRLDRRGGIWLEVPEQDTAALSLSDIAKLLQGKPVKTCLGTLTLKKE